jgi:ABC-type bacteriocin/lantibiotic exporter with double-glycine peptidase domain
LAQARADSLTQEYLLARKAHFRILFRQICFSLGLQAVASAALLGLGGWLVIEGQLSIGQLVAAELIVTVVVGSAVKLTKSLESYYDLMAAMDKLGHLFDLPLEREGGELFPKTQGPSGLEIRDWSTHIGHHAHHQHHDKQQTVSLAIKAGEKIALAGTTGTGKSLLLQSIVGLRESHGGRIMIDGVDLRQLDLSALREKIVLVSGKEIVQGTLFENIRMGRPEISPEQVRKALKVVGLENWAADLPKGWDTILVSGGSVLSSGETIQILLARAMVGKPSLLLLDGVLDGLASPLREDLARLVTSHDQNWTLLLVTNHPGIAGLCDREIVLGHSHGETHS